MNTDKMINLVLLKDDKRLGKRGTKIEVFSQQQAEYFQNQGIAKPEGEEIQKEEAKQEAPKKPTKK